MSQTYNQMTNVAAHCGGQQARRANYAMRMDQPACHFPAPAPHRVYCEPAAFQRTCGEPYHRMVVAYGQSRPSSC
jgi:hypothetical protein